MKTEAKIYTPSSAPKNFSWLDVFKSIWYFAEEDKRKLVILSPILFIILFYTLVPAYIVGEIVDFFTTYSSGESLRTPYLLIILLGVSYAIVSVIRLSIKKTIVVIGQKIRARVRIWGFERLTEFSLEWHTRENSGNKIQRIFTGSVARTPNFAHQSCIITN